MNAVYSVWGSFTQPNIYVPTGSNQPGCGTVTCTMAAWDALDTYAPGGQYILQTGSVGFTNYCEISCQTHYYLWWEDYESGSSSATFCTNAPSPGDTVTPVVQLTSGSSYDVYTKDTTSSVTCSSSPYPYTFSHTPYWGDFILERANVCSGGVCGADLAKFDNFWLQGKIAYYGASSGVAISRTYGNGWYENLVMVNSGVTNICSGSWSSPTCSPSVSTGTLTGYGEFYNTWISSQNT